MATMTKEMTVIRPIYRQDELHRVCKYAKPKRNLTEQISRRWNNASPWKMLKKTVPLIDWLPKYNWRNNILGDIVAGITVAVMHIPQGMAYAILGNVPSIVGIYMAFFPVLIYFLFGTSRHNSMGTFAVICMMTGKVVVTYSSMENTMNNSTQIDSANIIGSNMINHEYTPIQVATVVTFVVGLTQLGMYVLRLGVISSFLADSLISGFTTAAGLHVFTSQVKDLLGLTLIPRRGIFKLILTYFDIFNNIDKVNVAALSLSAITIVILIFNNQFLKPRFARISPFPIPIEMLVVVGGTLISMYMKLTEAYNIKIVGDIPVGLPTPSLPPLSLIPNVLLDSFIITLVSYTISMSMALIFAQKVGYEVDANQELVAQGLGNLFGSFFSCMPFTASLSRSLIQETVGGRTQLASFISCGILVSVLLWIGPFFEPLPRCILASIIVVALQGMLMKITDFLKFWKLDKIDAGIWAITFLTVILLDVEYGLIIGLFVCLTKLIIIVTQPYACLLALAPGTELYLDSQRYKGTIEITGIKIFHYSGSLNFASRQHFCDTVYKLTEVIPRKEVIKRNTKNSTEDDKIDEIKYSNSYYTDQSSCSSQHLYISRNTLNQNYGSTTIKDTMQTLILDFSAVTYIDSAGVNMLKNLINEYNEINVSVYITGTCGPVYEMMTKCNLLESNDHTFGLFPTISDAVYYAQHPNNIMTIST
ncbi:PREDICTED: solute carrier family 26 member 10-like isoform X1 [Polistes dominula]|uniref:Solute carrier family 26 member 10-like isoform X1 n=1 Tax=Polistes dominula TaxID=743375 RepID=A0ABM1HV33_POLDO|nr:PREDICTED: solute carrier family 26 member 10-like isoform X1 [Polistes dominula]XP_015171820.1 PREDICTED: solute carrier family 26 member 10-like isoform X1 [Polistes dominula]